jgi:thiol:disulfide interchange protein DsbG
MPIRTHLAIALALAPTVGAYGQAAEPTRRTVTDKPAVIKAIEQRGFQILGEFAAPGGLRGFAGATGEQPMAVYVTPDGEHAVVGTLVNAKGEDAGASALQRLVVEPMSKRIWAQLEKSHWVADGSAAAPRVVYAFSDANCPYCHRFWQAARRWVQSGKVQLRHILVGVIREDSANKAAAILTAASPSEAFTLNEQRHAQGGIQGIAVVPEEIRARLDANERLMLELGFQGTPGILFRDEAGLVQTRSGMPAPEDMEAVLGPR